MEEQSCYIKDIRSFLLIVRSFQVVFTWSVMNITARALIRNQAPYNGKRYLRNDDKKQVHDLENDKTAPGNARSMR